MSQQLKVNVRRTFAQRSSGRVNSVEFHPTEPWILTALQSGDVIIWDFKQKIIRKSIKISESPVCSARIVAQQNWFVCDADLVFLHVYDTSNWNKIKSFVAHDDIITCIVVHSHLPYIVSASDDGKIKLWDYENDWLVRIFDHSDCVKHIIFCPSESSTFASACLNGSLKIWDLKSQTPLTIAAHTESINSIGFFTSFNKTYVITASDDRSAKVWDYKTKSWLHTLSHKSIVSVVCICSDPSLIITGSADGEIHIWNSATFRLERILNNGLKGVSCLHLIGSQRVLIGYSDGITMIELNREFPTPCMDVAGNIFSGKNNIIQTVSTKTNVVGPTDGEILSFPVKELGKCEMYPQMLQSNSNGKYVSLCGDGYYAIYNAFDWKLKLSGNAMAFAWSRGPLEFAIWENATIGIFRAFKRCKTLRPGFPIESIFGGALLAVSAPNFIWFYGWSELELIYKLDVNARNVHWTDSNDLVAVDSDATFYILKYKSVKKKKGTLELLHIINERVRTGVWAKDCYVFINSSWCLRLCTDGVVTKMCNLNGMHYLDRPMNLVGYHNNQNQVYLVDKALNLVRYRVPQIPNDSMAVKPSRWKKVGLHDVRTRMMTQNDYEFSWKDELFNGQHIIPAVRDQGETSTCVFQSLCATGDIEKMKAAAIENPSRPTDIRFSATSFVDDYEKIAGAIPLDINHKRLRDGLKLFEKQGVHAEGGGAAPGRYKIASHQYDTRMPFNEVAELILQGKPVVGAFRVGKRALEI